MENTPDSGANRFFKTACLFEAALIIVAIALGWLTDVNPFANLYYSEAAIFYGIFGTLPLFLLFLVLEQLNAKSVVSIRQMLFQTLAPGLRQCNWADLFMLSAIAGISEELLFRGVLQPWLENAWGMHVGLVASSVIFGLVHAITPLYTVLATLVSIYLGLALDYGGERNLLIPVIIHGLYDFLALFSIMRNYRANI